MMPNCHVRDDRCHFAYARSIAKVFCLRYNQTAKRPFSEHKLRRIDMGATLRDIGLIAVPDRLSKPKAPLTVEDCERYESHAQTGANCRSCSTCSGEKCRWSALLSEVQQHGRYAEMRLSVTPGITCIWRTQSRRDDGTFDQWMDITYIGTCSFSQGIKRLLQTGKAVLTRFESKTISHEINL